MNTHDVLIQLVGLIMCGFVYRAVWRMKDVNAEACRDPNLQPSDRRFHRRAYESDLRSLNMIGWLAAMFWVASMISLVQDAL